VCRLLDGYSRDQIAALLDRDNEVEFAVSSKVYNLKADFAADLKRDIVNFQKSYAKSDENRGIRRFGRDHYDEITSVSIVVQSHHNEAPFLQFMPRATFPGGMYGAYGIHLPVTRRPWPDKEAVGPVITKWSTIPELTKSVEINVLNSQSRNRSLTSL